MKEDEKYIAWFGWDRLFVNGCYSFSSMFMKTLKYCFFTINNLVYRKKNEQNHFRFNENRKNMFFSVLCADNTKYHSDNTELLFYYRQWFLLQNFSKSLNRMCQKLTAKFDLVTQTDVFTLTGNLMSYSLEIIFVSLNKISFIWDKNKTKQKKVCYLKRCVSKNTWILHYYLQY